MKKYLFAIMAFLTFILTNCADDDGRRDPLQTGNGFKLSYSISDPTSVLTRSSIDFEEGEDKINSFYILFFENTTGGTGRFIDAIDVMASYDVSLGSSGVLDIPFPEGSSLDNSKEYKLLLCANIKKYTDIDGVEDLKTLCNGEMERDVLGLLMKISGVASGKTPEEEQSDNTHLMKMDNLPMSAGFVKKANEGTVEVELSRAVSRFDVYCKAPGYTLVSASIWNAYMASYIWEGSFTDFTEERTERYYGIEANSNHEIIGSLYAFENYVSSPEQKDKVTTCLIVGLRNEETGGREYFRTNVNVSTINGHQLKRNHVYTTVIKSVNGKGDDNERGAYENRDLLLDIDLESWILDDSGLIQIEGENVLAIPTSKARLFGQGDTREYNVYTIGPEVPSIVSRNLPGHIKATLKLAPGYSENSNFKTSILTFEATEGTTENSSETYHIELGFSTMLAPIVVEQLAGNADYVNLSSYDMIELSSEARDSSDEIVVTSSAPWLAEIAYGDYFSFETDSHQTTFGGDSGEGFTICTLEENPVQADRYCFVKIYLADKPEISRVIVLQQNGWDGKYITISPESVPAVPTLGGASLPITVQASGRWTASITSVGSSAWVVANGTRYENEFSGEPNASFTVNFPALMEENITPLVSVNVQLEGSDKSMNIVVSQTPISEYGTMVWTSTLGVSTLALIGTDLCSTTSSVSTNQKNHLNYVYDLSQFMRNRQLFGSNPDSEVYVQGGFRFSQGTVERRNAAIIWQFVSKAATNDEVSFTKQAMEEDSRKFLIFSNKGSIPYATLKTFGMQAGYTEASITATNAKKGYIFINKEEELAKPLIEYLTKTGPFTKDKPDGININNILLSGLGDPTYGLSKWPSTFTPIIINNNGSTPYCVFGVDLTQRFVFISDPSIFGSSTTSAKNYGNYVETKEDNVLLLKNFIAFLAEVTQKGEEFLKDFR